jgi:hypothetical protein
MLLVESILFVQSESRVSLAGKAVPMNFRSRHVRSSCPASPATPANPRPAIPDGIRSLGGGEQPKHATGPVKLRDLVLTIAAASVTAGSLYWHTTRSLPMSLGVVLLTAMAGITLAWLHAREETRQVQAREHGETERERIRHHAEIQLAEAQKTMMQAATRGPSETPGDAEALRLDARRALELSPPTTVQDAMRITRIPQAGTNPAKTPPEAAFITPPPVLCPYKLVPAPAQDYPPAQHKASTPHPQTAGYE